MDPGPARFSVVENFHPGDFRSEFRNPDFCGFSDQTEFLGGSVRAFFRSLRVKINFMEQKILDREF